VKLIVKKTNTLSGQAVIPGSKSHTIRAVIIGSLAEGLSHIKQPLYSADTEAAVEACQALGAEIILEKNIWIVKGFSGVPRRPGKVLDLRNSGTSLNLITGVVSLGDFETILDGDQSLRSRPVQPLLDALNLLGAQGVSLRGNGCPPIKIKGKIKGGHTRVEGKSSQFVSSLLLCTPLAQQDTEIEVIQLQERPYVEMTLHWLSEQGIHYQKNDSLSWFRIPGRQKYQPFEKTIPGDWSSATFLLAAGALTDSDIIIKGLDRQDTQGDQVIVQYLKKMGAEISWTEKGLRIQGRTLKGTNLDLNNTPDALPALAVLGCLAEGETKLYNVAHARIKETDRIKVMAKELSKMGAQIKELPDGLLIRQSKLKGIQVNGHSDHRVVMALALAGLVSEGTTTITTAEAVSVTFPDFVEIMKNLGAHIKTEQ